MVDLQLDQDVSEALKSGVVSIANQAERERVSHFLSAVNAARAEVSVERLEIVASAGHATYENRTPELHLGWQKVILVETGLAGEQLENYDSVRSYEVMKWSYDHCKTQGYTIDDVDKGTPMGEYMYNINLAIIQNMPLPTVSPPAGVASTTGAGCLITTASVIAVLVVAVRHSTG